MKTACVSLWLYLVCVLYGLYCGVGLFSQRDGKNCRNPNYNTSALCNPLLCEIGSSSSCFIICWLVKLYNFLECGLSLNKSIVLLLIMCMTKTICVNLSVCLRLLKKSAFFYYSVYFCYYLWVSLHILVLFMGSIFSYLLVLSIVLSAKKFQFQLNKLFPNKH